MNKRLIVKKILTELKKRNLLKESPEGDSNAFTTQLQKCVELLSDLPAQLQVMLAETVQQEDIDVLQKAIGSVEFVNKTLNEIITKHTAGLTEDTNSSSVNMSIDKVIEHPDDLKKLGDKKIQVNVLDDDGQSLTEEDNVEPKLDVATELDKVRQVADFFRKYQDTNLAILSPDACKMLGIKYNEAAKSILFQIAGGIDYEGIAKKLAQSRKPLTESKKLIKEYFASAGESVQKAFEYLEIYNDILSPEDEISKHFDWAKEPEVQAVIAKYKPIAEKLYNLASTSKKTLTQRQAQQIDSLIYGGSDAYDDAQMYCKYMPEYYDNQIRNFSALLKANV